MKKITQKMIAFLLVICIGMTMLAGHASVGSCGPMVVQAKKTDYSRYSNSKKSWFVKRASDHQPSEGAVSAKSLATYNAYYYDYKTKDKVIYLTFDCGYENGYTGRILDILKKYDVKAVFFVTKHFVKSQPELCKRMKEEGHLVGNHTMNHPSLPTKSVSQIRNEVRGLEQIFKEETGYQLDKYFRPPMGEFSDRILKVVQDMGYTTVFWSMAYYDYDPAKQPGKQYVIDHFKKYYHKGAIPLLHNISKSNTEALNEVLKFLKKQGYQCMRIDAIGQSADPHVAVPQWEKHVSVDREDDAGHVVLEFYADVKKKDIKPEGFEIYRKEKGGKYKLLGIKKANKTLHCVYKDSTAKEGRTYYYKVKAYCYLYGKKYVTNMPAAMKRTVVSQLENDSEQDG